MIDEFYKFQEMLSEKYISLDKKHIAQILAASKCKYPVLITGQTGVGKELVANAIHKHGILRNKPLVAVNCALIPKENLYGELFGVQGGAYTGVPKTRHGLFEEANNGTIFLDEIGDLPLDAQAGLLRVLETGEIRRLGQRERDARKIKRLNVRIIAATNKNISESSEFRSDLYFRLKVILIHICNAPH